MGETDNNHAHSRRFRVYNVGLAKTGTTSLAKILGNYQSQHEFLLRDTGQMVKDFANHQISDDEFRHFLRLRDQAGNLEMDSTFCHSHYLDILLEEFPLSQCIFTIRDCYSWVDSVLNMMATHRAITHVDLIFGLSASLVGNPAALREQFDLYIDDLLRYWSTRNAAILEHLPKDRSLLIKTHEISSRLDDIADFIGIPAATLNHHESHAFPALQKFDILRDVDAKCLEDKVTYYCSALMKQYFPAYSFEDFLQGRRPSSCPQENTP